MINDSLKNIFTKSTLNKNTVKHTPNVFKFLY